MTTVEPSPPGPSGERSATQSAEKSAQKSAEKSGHLTLDEIAQLVAQAIVDQHQRLTETNKTWVYATDRDELVDFLAHQSVNANPSNNLGNEH